ncbi:MAG: multicopper oxidase domain-containing protein [Candidatus Eremiobacteraeota bacterium]|nr:multicopper oxidase domain-containing protein [Candidatus Eremiobacteraeota bacterium]
MRALPLALALAVMLTVLLPVPAFAVTRTYYIAADEVIWNYTPGGRDLISDKPLPAMAPTQFGWSYRKAIYRGYSDATFKHLTPRTSQDAYLGLLGPVIRAEVGDQVIVVFKNNSRIPLSVHAHGLMYDKASEGALYQDGTAKKADDAVPPGHVYTYHWSVPDRAGPARGDPSSVIWMYHSHTDEYQDVNTGPVGSIVVTGRGQAKPNGAPKDVDREVFTVFAEFDEGASRYLAVNQADLVLNPKHAKALGPAQGDNEFFTINGFLFGTMPVPILHKGERVRWYVMATMSDFDFHTPHWHGQTVTADGMRTDLVELSPMSMRSVEMLPDNVGLWLFHCHVMGHLSGGMEARFKVVP